MARLLPLLFMLSLAACISPADDPVFARRNLPQRDLSPRQEGDYPLEEQLRRVRNGMTRREVYLLLGEPRHRRVGEDVVWLYGQPGGRQLMLTFVGGFLQGFDFDGR